MSPPDRHVVITPDARLRLVDRPQIRYQPSTCRFPDMPIAAIRSACVDAASPPDDIARALVDVLHPFDVSRSNDRWREPFSSDHSTTSVKPVL